MTAKSHRMDRRALFSTGAAAALLAATGVSAADAPKRGGRLRIALSGASRADGFDTRGTMGLFMQIATVGAVFDTLTEVAADGTLRGELATGWKCNRHADHWVFELREGVSFHNGAEFTADDVAASLDLHRDGALATITDMRVLRSHRLEIRLSQPDPHFPFSLSDPRYVIYPAQHIVEAMATGIGTGLYRARRFDPGRQFIGQRVESHFKDGRAGWFDEVELISLPDARVRAQALDEMLVDAADLDRPDGLVLPSDLVMMPEINAMTQAVWPRVAIPTRVGAQRPFDNLRAAERWWLA